VSSSIKAFEEIDARFFDISQDIPEEYTSIMSIRLEEMKEAYFRILKEVGKSNDELHLKVSALDKINSKLHIPHSHHL
jgi:hypothetical protein